MRRTFLDLMLRVTPLTAITFGAAIYVLMLHRHPQGGLLSCGLGLLSGLAFGIAIGYLARTIVYQAQVDNLPSLSQRLELALLELGYRTENRFQKVVTFRPLFRAGIFADRFRIELLQGGVRIEGPAHHVDKLVTKLGF